MHDKLLCDETFAKILQPNSSTNQHPSAVLNNVSNFKNQETGLGQFNNHRLRKGDIIKEYYQKQKDLMSKGNHAERNQLMLSTPYTNSNPKT
jgi:hypothetical protein